MQRQILINSAEQQVGINQNYFRTSNLSTTASFIGWDTKARINMRQKQK